MAALVSPAHAGGMYGKLFGGVTLGGEQDIEIEVPGEPVLSGEMDTDAGFVVGGALGFNLAEVFALEGEIAFRSNNVSDLSFATTPFPVEGQLESLSFMGNGVFMTPNQTGVRPYVGAGIGGALRNSLSGNEFVFAYQGFAGAETNISPKMTAGLEYRYFGTADAVFENAGTLTTSYDAHSVNFVLKRKF